MTEQALLIANRDGVITLWNDTATDLFGHAADAAIGASLDLIVPEDFRARHWDGFNRAFTDGIRDMQRIARMPVLCADRQVRHFPGHLLPIKGPHGELVAIAGVYAAPSDRDDGLFTIS